ncbi:WG containing repeat-containing protein [Lishizhenia tianjinensis]|uniref:WG containing repeat-containing protein n=1 Tax=Lishizhenia tianjinensis TaxID=477690 RepID=A0A1I6YML1_9FLAO|nr:WG repeat-containing protein [Lishizhenia tianjinensis]SFT51634.1 WG containing repeat-containing protein [Lishizhenia tianjinensis]
MKKALYIFLGTVMIAGCATKKGFEAMQAYNYFEAKEKLEKVVQRDSTLASFALAALYSRGDNPFTDLDKAYLMVNTAINAYVDLEPKTILEYKENYDYSIDSLRSLRADINEKYFLKVQEENTIARYNYYINTHTESKYVDSAVFLRDQLAYIIAKADDSNKGYQEFLSKYPTSVFADEIQRDYFRTQFSENTKEGTVEAFHKFSLSYPNSPYRKYAQDQVYELSIPNHSIEEYAQFVSRYSNHPRVNEAWMKLYKLSTVDYSKTSIEKFKKKYPAFPFGDKVEKELALVEEDLLPIQIDGKYGYMDSKGSLVVEAQFLSAGFFKEGMAIVEKDGLYGYIDKTGVQVADYVFDDAYDFVNGRAVVEMNGKMGMIDRTGEMVIPTIFEDLGPFMEGMCYGKKEGQLYGYYDAFGSTLLDPIYQEAYSFNDGVAKVTENGKVGYIYKDGTYYLQPRYEDLIWLSDEVLKAKKYGYQKLVDVNYDEVILEPLDEIGVLSSNRILFMKNGKIGYVDARGNMIIDAQTFDVFDNAQELAEFRNNYARINQAGKYGMIDSLGKVVIPAVFSYIGDYGKLIAITKGNGWGYTNLTTRLIIPYQYEYAESFRSGIGIVQQNSKYGAINEMGEFVIPAEYMDIRYLTDELLVVNQNNRMGIINVKGEVVVPPIYHRIKQQDEDLFILYAGETFSYYQISTNRFISIQ